MVSPISFQGVSSGLQTDALVNAIMEQEGRAVQRLRDRQSLNLARSSALKAFQTNLTTLSSSLLTLGATSFNSRSVTSSDSNSTYVSASASGAASGTYDVVVSQLATRGRLAGVDLGGGSYSLSAASATDSIFAGGTATFAVQGTDGVVKTVTLSDAAGTNNLNGLRDAINASGAGVTASVINTGKGDTPYQLVLNAKETGAGSTSGLVTLADVTNPGGPSVNTIGIAAGTVLETDGEPTGIQAGTTSAIASQNAVFTLNGVELERQTNVVTDAVSGVTFTLKKGGQDAGSPTSLTVTQDNSAITSAVQDVIGKYNALLQAYKSASSSTKDSEGNIRQNPLNGDTTSRLIMAQIRTALSGTPEGLPDDATYKSMAELGIKTNRDGTLSLDTTIFKAALDNDADAVKNVFAFSGVSTNASVSFSSATSKTSSGTVAFDITDFVSGGAISGTLTYDGQSYGATGSNGVLSGPVGSPLEGLSLNVTATGSGTIQLSKGLGQSIQDLVAEWTSFSGTLSSTLDSITTQNETLEKNIERGQALLDRRKETLKLQFSQMETTIAQLRAAGDSLMNLG